MDVSIAVSLIRGQMGAVVERAVNVAVETVLAEMLKVVGVKFEELKAQLALMKRDVTALQREKALKEKENDNIRAKLRYTELKLKYYRQGVEEELQQRASASALVRIHPSTFQQAQRGSAGVSSTETSPSCSTQTRTSEALLVRSKQECTSPQSTSRHAIRVRCHLDAGGAGSDPADLLLPISISVNTPTESVDSSTEATAQSKDDDQQGDCEWAVTLQPHAEGTDAVPTPPAFEVLTLDPGEQQPVACSLTPDVSPQADSSTLPSSAPQVKQEMEEVICIKEEPEDEQEVMATLLMDCQVQQGHLPESEAQGSVTEWSGLTESQRNHTTAFSSAGPSTYVMPQSAGSLLSMVALPSGIAARQAVRPWTKDLSLYEEYKLRRNELRRRNLSRRRELEKTLPQPLLADLVRERREKTRLRVARWRAKRKLQACLNQSQVLGGAAGLSQAGFPISSQHHQLLVPCELACCVSAATSSSQQRQSSASPQSSTFLNNMSAANSTSATLPFIPSSSSSSSSSSLLPRGPSLAPHQHTVTSSSSSYPQVSLSQQSISLTDADILQ
ncbi:uncharacterized protein si:ch211-67e16.4 isoform X2 [Dicentrarchus labrax]|uniref:uncharacterized protein si:ch211-67e16.4 isoform X2 n=1 Tax=Dicentrarchus labrax TaxID=13489 RepID=UPI0021F53DBA|nr:uncharacterized protein si:ch211-67e16.4 isoform X2 [Dicentrarchus labrax]